MNSGQLNIHPKADLEARVIIDDYPERVVGISKGNWQTLQICVGNFKIYLFTETAVGLIHLKNEILWTFEAWERKQKEKRDAKESPNS